LGYIYVADKMGQSSFRYLWWAMKNILL